MSLCLLNEKNEIHSAQRDEVQGRSQGGQKGAVPPAKPTVPPANFDRVI